MRRINPDKVVPGYKEYIASISYGKDSLAMLEVIFQNGYPLDKIVTTDIWATREEPAYHEDVVNFRNEADNIIKERYGLEVIHLRDELTYEECFYKTRGERAKPENRGKIWGFPRVLGSWCVHLKTDPIKKFKNKNQLWYIGYAIDEKSPKRQAKIKNAEDKRIYPLVEERITEAECMEICKKLNLLAPTYSTSLRDGCWFCNKQSLEQLRQLRKKHPDKWQKLLEWDNDSPYSFRIDATVKELDERFEKEEETCIHQ